MCYLLYTKSIHEHDVVSKGPVDIKINLFDFWRVQLGLLFHSLPIKQMASSKIDSMLISCHAVQDNIKRQPFLDLIMQYYTDNTESFILSK